jgi:hypothetical protein
MKKHHPEEHGTGSSHQTFRWIQPASSFNWWLVLICSERKVLVGGADLF